MKLQRPAPSSEKGLFILTIFLCLLGLLFVFEASVAEAFATFGDQWYFVRQQSMWLGVGLAGMVAGVLIPLSFWRSISKVLFAVSILLLFAVFLPGLGKEVNGAQRWINLGVLSLQPVEVLKFSMVMFYADWLTKHQKLGTFLLFTLLPVGLLFLQPDMGSALIVLGIAFGMYFAAGAPLKTFSFISLAGVAVLALAIIISPYRFQRLTTFINPDSDPLGASFHIRQITIALGNGGWLGQGIGKSRQKFSYIPEASTDSIFAIIAEEIGFIGSLILFSLFMLYIHWGLKIVGKTEPHSYEHLVSMGIVLWIGLQIMLNLSAVVALVPLTGIPLPFFSYGGTSLVMVLCVTGILVGIGRSATHHQK
jgi:cell division protein FtsW